MKQKKGKMLPDDVDLRLSDIEGPEDDDIELPEGDLTEEVVHVEPSKEELKKRRRRATALSAACSARAATRYMITTASTTRRIFTRGRPSTGRTCPSGRWT